MFLSFVRFAFHPSNVCCLSPVLRHCHLFVVLKTDSMLKFSDFFATNVVDNSPANGSTYISGLSSCVCNTHIGTMSYPVKWVVIPTTYTIQTFAIIVAFNLIILIKCITFSGSTLLNYIGMSHSASHIQHISGITGHYVQATM